MKSLLRWVICLLVGFSVITHFGATAEEQTPSIATELNMTQEPVAASLVSENESIQPGSPFWVAIHLNIEKGWHAYWKNPGDAGMGPVIDWQLPEGFTVETVEWPVPKRFAIATAVGFGYEEELTLLAKINPPQNYTGKEAAITADARWVVCNDATCLPGDAQLKLTLPVNAETPKASTKEAALFKHSRDLLPKPSKSIVAQRKAGLVELSISEAGSFEKAEFFPEDKKLIDHKKDAVLSKDKPDSYTVAIKETKSSSTLNGILVLYTAQGKEAYNIHLPIARDPNNSYIGLADNPTDLEDPATMDSEVADDSAPSNMEFEGGFFWALLFAFAGGMILNLMPCVLPVISFKVLGFVKMAGESRSLILKHGLAFSFGVLLSFWVLASLLLVLQTYGRAVGWGFQLQEPLFVAILASLLFVFGLSLFGLFEIGTSLIAAAGQVQPKKGKELFGSFLSGVLATAVATPCTGPFLGSAVGFAVTLPAMMALAIFTTIGLGMCAPYLALAAFPSFLRYVPKPGNWMIVFKEIMGFLMMATVLWLLWVFGAQTNSFAITLLLGGFLFFAIGGWIYGKWGTPLQKKMTRTIVMVLAAALFGIGSYSVLLSTSDWAEAMGGGTNLAHEAVANVENTWEEFSPQRVEELRKQGIPVFIDFTAKWCLVCQANHLVLSGDDVAQKFKDKKVVRMKADWTKRDDVIAAELRKFGRNSVPLYVMYDNDGEPTILPQVLTPDLVKDKLTNLKNTETTQR